MKPDGPSDATRQKVHGEHSALGLRATDELGGGAQAGASARADAFLFVPQCA